MNKNNCTTAFWRLKFAHSMTLFALHIMFILACKRRHVNCTTALWRLEVAHGTLGVDDRAPGLEGAEQQQPDEGDAHLGVITSGRTRAARTRGRARSTAGLDPLVITPPLVLAQATHGNLAESSAQLRSQG